MADFFSRVKKNINKGISTVSEKSTLMLETAKIKGQIAKLEDQRNQLFQDLGRNVYVAYGSDSLDEQFVAEKCDEIRAIELAIMEKAEELQALTEGDKPENSVVEESVARCECGTELQPGAKFCLDCGKPVSVVPVAAVDKCECGADIQPGTKFCMNCGKQLAE